MNDVEEQLLRIFINHQLMCAKFIQICEDEYRFLFGEGTIEPKGILSAK